MNKTIGYVLVLVVLIGLAFGLYMFVPRVPGVSSNSASTTPATTATEMRVVDVYETTSVYKIEAHYPQFGISATDTKIKAAVDTALMEFKKYPPIPDDSSVELNEFTGNFNSVYLGADVISVALSFSEYTGGAHPNTVIVGVNVDEETGNELTLDDALSLIGKTLPQVSTESMRQLKVILGEDIIAPEGADPKPENYDVFLVGKDKVTFIFNNYQVAPYAAGHQEVWFARVK